MTAPAPTLRLYDWPVSPFCHKVRAVLAHKGLAFERVPALQHRAEIKRRGKIGKVPALELDGEFLVDSTDIVHALERRFPATPVLPPDAAARARCHVIEDWCDESLYFLGLYFHWREPSGRRAAHELFSRTLLGRLSFWPIWLRINRQLDGQGTGRKSEAQIRTDLARHLDAIEAMLEREWLLGDGPWLCDFSLMAQLVYLSRAAALSQAFADRPRINAFLARMKTLHQR